MKRREFFKRGIGGALGCLLGHLVGFGKPIGAAASGLTYLATFHYSQKAIDNLKNGLQFSTNITGGKTIRFYRYEI